MLVEVQQFDDINAKLIIGPARKPKNFIVEAAEDCKSMFVLYRFNFVMLLIARRVKNTFCLRVLVQ